MAYTHYKIHIHIIHLIFEPMDLMLEKRDPVDYIRIQHSINENDIFNQMEWVENMCIAFGTSDKTMFLARLYLDLFLCKYKIKNQDTLKYVTAACFFIASKIEDDKYSGLKSIVRFIKNERKKTKQEKMGAVIRFERIILKKIDYHLNFMTTMDYIIMKRDVMVKTHGLNLAKFVFKNAVVYARFVAFNYVFYSYTPETCADSCWYMAMKHSNNFAHQKELQCIINSYYLSSKASLCSLDISEIENDR